MFLFIKRTSSISNGWGAGQPGFPCKDGVVGENWVSYKYYSKYLIEIMVIKIYILYFYQSPILMGRRPETVLMNYFNNLSIEDKLFVENISSQYFRQIYIKKNKYQIFFCTFFSKYFFVLSFLNIFLYFLF
jgi:hypothetical protein